MVCGMAGIDTLAGPTACRTAPAVGRTALAQLAAADSPAPAHAEEVQHDCIMGKRQPTGALCLYAIFPRISHSSVSTCAGASRAVRQHAEAARCNSAERAGASMAKERIGRSDARPGGRVPCTMAPTRPC